ncbi:MAG: hypothetical protein JWO33_526 [Caulobacteraceae bacterium]|nr:hypothetical protein [Caulobacteraceae bacterium]
MGNSMKYALIAGLAAAALATAAAAADEDWMIVGGDGSALGYDRAAVKKDTAGRTSVRYGVYSATAMPPPPSMAASTLFGFTGTMTLNCQDKSFKTGETTYYFAYGGERTMAAAPNAAFEKPKGNDFHAFFFDAVCGGRKFFDSYGAKTRADAVAVMKKVSATPHVTNTGAKGWTFAQGDGARLLAMDTTTAKRTGDTVLQSEISWMRKPQTTNGQTWRYYQLVTEYDCAKGRRRGNGSFRIYDADDRPVHEETVSDAPWETLSGPEATSLLEMVCKNKKLAGLPSGPRAAMLARLKELAALP